MNKYTRIAALLGWLLLCLPAFSQNDNDTLKQQFLTPPNSAKPRVWWHWMNGNISKDGIAKDLDWMNRSGIGGFQNFDAGYETPQIVAKRLSYMTPEWKDAFRFTAKLADSLHLEMAIAGSPGWSESGGPWVKPEEGMKKIVWSETRVHGGATNLKVPAPPGVTGPFQNVPVKRGWDETANKLTLPQYYRDVAVIAVRLPAADKSLADLAPVVTSSGGTFTLAQLTDGDLAKTSFLPSDSATGFAWIQYTFAKPQTIKAITLVGGGEIVFLSGDLKEARSLEVSNDGKNFRQVCYIPAGGMFQQTLDIPATTSRYFRVSFKNPGMPAYADSPAEPGKKIPGTEVAEMVLHTTSRINMFEQKDAFAASSGFPGNRTLSTKDVIKQTDVINVTSKMKPDGALNWTAPPGNWNIIRFGYSLLGITNHPASLEATGLEVDKLDSAAVRSYFTNYLDQYKNATGGWMGNKGGLQYMVTDSWEAGTQNWTGNLPQEFQKRRGYSLLPWMPVLSGYIVKSAEASERFLFDYRKTLSDLVATYHYDQLTHILAEYGMKRYSESHETGRALIADGMEVKRTAAVPMAAMWTPNIFSAPGQPSAVADIHESASVAHIYGQNLVAAESLTAGDKAWAYCPENLKTTADLELASGLNRFAIHTSVHQPVDDKIPGLGLGGFGQWFNRHETWAEEAKPWIDYLARSSYLLQQGKFVADVLYYYGEDNNITAMFGNRFPAVPEGYNYDYINADALLHMVSVKDGKIVTASGMSYRILVLDSNAKQMSLPVLRKINELVKAGAVVSGAKPEATPSLSDDETEFAKLVNETWRSSNTTVFTGKPLSEVLTSLNIAPDFAYTKPQAFTRLMYVHRKLADRDIYWVNNRNDTAQTTEATFRVAGKVPQIWHAQTGKTEAASYSIANGVTQVPLHLEPNDAVFIIFTEKAVQPTVTLPAIKETLVATLSGDWQVRFQPNRGAPASIVMNGLQSYTESKDSGVKYFSGTASYTKTIEAKADWFKRGTQLWIDLGAVKNIAEIFVNGKPLGIVWKKPFRVEVTDALKAGANQVEIKVTNLWVNRLIGDEQPGVVHKITYTTQPFYKADSPLLPSGLLGPVEIIQKR